MNLTLEGLDDLWGKVKPPPGPKIDERTLLFAGLDCFALHGDKIEELERLTGKDIFWSGALDGEKMEEMVIILNPPEFKMPELKFEKPKPGWTVPIAAFPGVIITGV